jgi:DNA helicase-2/ATP-dependent DNA helicase PcrA
MVVVRDEEARRSVFGFDRLFGTKGRTKTDLESEASGKEAAVERTCRIFCVAGSRAEEGLAVVYYAADPELTRDAMVRQGSFKSEEIELVGQ